MLTGDKFQRHGLGTELRKRLVEFARAEGLDRVTADILAEHYAGDNVVKAELELRAP